MKYLSITAIGNFFIYALGVVPISHFETTMASVGILAHRNILNGNQPYDIPDFRKEEDCIKYENDRETPFYGSDGSKPTIPCSSR